jgi:hypothetical protein
MSLPIANPKIANEKFFADISLRPAARPHKIISMWRKKIFGEFLAFLEEYISGSNIVLTSCILAKVKLVVALS